MNQDEYNKYKEKYDEHHPRQTGCLIVVILLIAFWTAFYLLVS